MRGIIRRIAAVGLAALSLSAAAADLTEAPNYRAYNDMLSSSGQPDAEQLAHAAELGFERVIYLSFVGDSTALEGEDGIAVENGMRYVQLPVDWDAPKVDDFRAFAAIMQAEPDARALPGELSRVDLQLPLSRRGTWRVDSGREASTRQRLESERDLVSLHPRYAGELRYTRAM